jgi:hypothetical protein
MSTILKQLQIYCELADGSREPLLIQIMIPDSLDQLNTSDSILLVTLKPDKTWIL